MSNIVNCMVPARMGSQRVKNKNIKSLNGKPLITYVLNSISKSKKLFNNIYLNSESKKLKDTLMILDSIFIMK